MQRRDRRTVARGPTRPARGVGPAGLGLLALGLVACSADRRPAPELDRLRQPTGIAVSPDGRFALVSNGNWDGEESDGTVVVLDLDRLHDRIEGGACDLDDEGLHCPTPGVIASSATVRVGTGLGNLVLDRPGGPDGPLRAMLPVRSPVGIAWMDVETGPDGARLDCGQGDDRLCDDDHRIRRAPGNPDEELPGEPARIALDTEGYRFLYVPHLGGGNLSLVALDGDRGPQLTQVVPEFFTPRADGGSDLAGGFAVAQLPCDPAAPPTASRDCSRPVLYASQRYNPGLRAFTVATGLELVQSGREITIPALDPGLVASGPYMGDVAFEEPTTGEHLLVVQTNPAALVRLDMRLGDDGAPRADVLTAVPLCTDPNVLTLDRTPGEPRLALVACYDAGELAVVDLATFRVMATIEVGAGAADVVVSPTRRVAYVTATRADRIAVVSLDRTRSDYLTVRAFLENG